MVLSTTTTRTQFEKFAGQEGVFLHNIKSVVRGGLDSIHGFSSHFPKYVKKKCGLDGKKGKMGITYDNKRNVLFGHLKHFFSRTAEEFHRKIFERGYKYLGKKGSAGLLRKRIFMFFG